MLGPAQCQLILYRFSSYRFSSYCIIHPPFLMSFQSRADNLASDNSYCTPAQVNRYTPPLGDTVYHKSLFPHIFPKYAQSEKRSDTESSYVPSSPFGTPKPPALMNEPPLLHMNVDWCVIFLQSLTFPINIYCRKFLDKSPRSNQDILSPTISDDNIFASASNHLYVLKPLY